MKASGRVIIWRYNRRVPGCVRTLFRGNVWNPVRARACDLTNVMLNVLVHCRLFGWEFKWSQRLLPDEARTLIRQHMNQPPLVNSHHCRYHPWTFRLLATLKHYSETLMFPTQQFTNFCYQPSSSQQKVTDFACHRAHAFEACLINNQSIINR